MSMSQAMGEVIDDPVDIYWLTVKFYKHQDKFEDFFHVMVNLAPIHFFRGLSLQVPQKGSGRGNLQHWTQTFLTV